MSDTIYYSGTLVTVTCWCGIRHAVPSALRGHQERQWSDGRPQDAIYCPLGHTHIIAGEGKAARLARALEEEKRRRKAAHDLLAQEERSHAATRGHLTRAKKRSAHGVCPCCKRTFKQLDRHMKSKHPGFVADADK